VQAELNDGMLRLGPTQADLRDTYRFIARPGGGLAGAAFLVPVRPGSRSAAGYRLERDRLVIYWRGWPRDLAVTLKPAARMP
jgi:hypothetical protein